MLGMWGLSRETVRGRRAGTGRAATGRLTILLPAAAVAGVLAAGPVAALDRSDVPHAAGERLAQAGTPAAGQATRRFDIPSQPLSSALTQFGRQAGLQVAVDSTVVSGLRTDGLRGDYTPEQAIARLLAGTGLGHRYTGADTITLERRPAGDAERPLALAPIAVTATREGGAIDTLSRSVTVIARDDIEKQAATARNAAEILAKTVPGMAPSSQTLTNFGQTLRGRDVLVLVDGVPLRTSRNVSRDLFNILPSSIESIEVIHGGSAAYGGGAAGGVIHINTLRGEDGPPTFETTLSGGGALSRLDGEALFGQVQQQVSGRDGAVDYLVSLTGGRTQGFFDADGDRIPPEPSQGDLSDTGTLDLLGKAGYAFGDQRLQFTLSYLNAEQDTDFTSDPVVDAQPRGAVKARAAEGLRLDDQTRRENLILNLGYSNPDLLGSKVDAQTYYRDYHTRFTPFDGRAFSSTRAIAQTFLDAEVVGGRLTVDTPLPGPGPLDAKLLWGADVGREVSSQPATIFDPAAFDASGGTRFVVIDDERTFVPEITTESYGLFGQLELSPLDWLILRGGVRHEWIDVTFPDFTTLGGGNAIEGGEIDYAETTFNLGTVLTPVDGLDVFANFTQAFELPDVGLQLRLAPVGFNAENANLSPRITDNYELGLRGSWRGFSGSIAGFYSESDLGRVLIENFSLVQDRTPERIYGIEADARYDVGPRLGFGGTFTWLEGEREAPGSGDDIALNGFRIPPVKLTGFVEYRPHAWWDLRLQVLYSGNRDDAADDGVGFGGRKVDDYTVVDLYSRFAVGPGTLHVGIENLLNNQYHNVFGQLLRNGRNVSHVAAPGATARIAYNIKW